MTLILRKMTVFGKVFPLLPHVLDVGRSHGFDGGEIMLGEARGGTFYLLLKLPSREREEREEAEGGSQRGGEHLEAGNPQQWGERHFQNEEG